MTVEHRTIRKTALRCRSTVRAILSVGLLAAMPPIIAQADSAADIERLQDLNRRDPSEDRAWAIVALIQDHRHVPEQGRAAARARLRTAFDRLNEVHERILAGRFTASLLNSQWGQAMVQARSDDAQDLFRRILADQYDDDTLLSLEIDRAAFAPLFLLSKAKLNRDNAQWLKAVLQRIGWFDIGHYGEQASMAAWLIVQHADFDPQWQAEMVAVLRPRIARGDMQPRYFAYLVDRVAVNQGQPQDYGTQGRCTAAGWQNYAIRDPGDVDARRRSVGLEPLEAYRARFGCN